VTMFGKPRAGGPRLAAARGGRRRLAGRAGGRLVKAAPAACLGVLAALLVACSGTGKGLIPVADAGPLQNDFEAVAQAAENGNGSCSGTENALLKTEQDFAALPPSVDAGLRSRIRQGIDNLRTRSLELCAQPLPQSTLSTSTPKTTTTETTSTPTETTTTPTETSTTTSPSGPGGGTPAPGEEAEEEGPGLGKGEGGGKDHKERGGAGGTEPGPGGEGR
jgi:hypothetical protein